MKLHEFNRVQKAAMCPAGRWDAVSQASVLHCYDSTEGCVWIGENGNWMEITWWEEMKEQASFGCRERPYLEYCVQVGPLI